MSKANVDKIRRGENVNFTELNSAATTFRVSTTEQGRPRDLHSIAADLGRALGIPVKIHQ